MSNETMLDHTGPIQPATPQGFGYFVGTHTEFIKPGYGFVTLDIQPHHLNSLGIVHGGAILTLLDHACGAALTFGSGQTLGKAGVTISLNATFIKSAGKGVLFATGRCLKKGRSIAFCQAEIEDQNGNIIATANSSFIIIS